MDALLVVVLFAAISLILLLVYEKRNSILNFLKEKVFKPKPIKLPKNKKMEESLKEHKDPDKEIKSENISYGSFTLPEEEKEPQTENPIFSKDTIFGSNFDYKMQEKDENEDFDIDKMLAEIEEERRETSIKTYGKDILETPDFSSMSIGELDTILEDSLGMDYDTYKTYLPAFEEDLSGEELAEAIKSLPRSIKILLVGDIFKRKE